MPWVLAGLTDLVFKNLKTNKIGFCDKAKNFDINIEVFNNDDFVFEAKKTVDFSFLESVKLTKNPLKKYLNYAFEKPSNLAIKNTVSSMLQENSDDGVSYNFEPKKLEVFESSKQDIDSAKLGTIYHNIMQKIDFTTKQVESIDKINEY